MVKMVVRFFDCILRFTAKVNYFKVMKVINLSILNYFIMMAIRTS